MSPLKPWPPNDILSDYRDDEGNVRVHHHRTYVQTTADGEQFFAVCMTCGALPGYLHDREVAQGIADTHTRNTGHVVPGF